MPAGNHGEALFRVAEELCAELARGEEGEAPGPRSDLGAGTPTAGILGAEDQALVAGLREALARIATALGARPTDPRTPRVQAALDGAEVAILGELIGSNGDRLPQLMPSLVFMVALPIVDQDRALELSRRTSQLIAEAQEY